MHTMSMPAEHPARRSLNAELHARPPEALPESARISFVALAEAPTQPALAELCRLYGVEAPREGSSHASLVLGPFQLKWERHTEFARFKFILPVDQQEPPFSGTALAQVPAEWLAELPGKIVSACHVEVRPAVEGVVDVEDIANRWFSGNALVGAEVAGGSGNAFTDFIIREDGFTRILIQDRSMTARQRGRVVQRLVEIDAYCMMAMLTFPVARDLMANLSRFEGALNEITNSMRTTDKEEEPVLLDRLTLLHSDLVRENTASQFRLSAARAYSSLVSFRMNELREVRIEGLQTFREFMARRMDPAMRTCEAASSRLRSVSESVSQATQLLQTRVDVTREMQNQSLLESMDKRARLQLRLQETVEGLSLAAITYYIVGLLGYAVAGIADLELLPVHKPVALLASIPVVLLGVAWALRRARARMHQ